MLADTAKQLIATYIAIGIARMFAGMPKMSGGQSIDISALMSALLEVLAALVLTDCPVLALELTAAQYQLEVLTLLASVVRSCLSLERRAISFQTTQWAGLTLW